MNGNTKRVLWRWLLLAFPVAAALAGMIWLGNQVTAVSPTLPSAQVSGVVANAAGPLAGAHVRARATDNLAFSDANGRFTLTDLAPGVEIEVAAWYTGHYVANAHITPTVSGLTLILRPYHSQDHPDYQWVSPIAGSSEGACGNCHPAIVPRWGANAHGAAISNPRFYALYNGTNLSGATAAGPGYLNDFPGTAGLCASCHAPGAAVATTGGHGYMSTNMNDVRGEITAGIHCDYCHKIGGVYLDPASDLPYDNVPGAESYRLLRPPAGDDIFFGPYDDVHDPDTYLPAISESAFCAGCHQFSFWGTPIYESYREWLQSPYAEQGVTCQDCHMPPSGDAYFAPPAVGGVARDPATIPGHFQLGAMDEEFLATAVSLTLHTTTGADLLTATVAISNSNTGHHVPTDFPGRQLILLVTAVDEQDQPLSFVSGPAIPAWSTPEAGQPGVIYAKLLQDAASGAFPVISYWKQTLIVSDNRIPALETAVSQYTFSLPNGVTPQVEARLFLRRVLPDVAATQEWNAPDMLLVIRRS